jgi:hypothetical protein
MVHSSYTSGQRTDPPEIDTSVPNSARIWNYWLGGKDNYPVDRETGDEYRAIYPEIVDVARASRQFLSRAVRYLAGEAQVRQFLDIGTGLPTVDNTHEVAQRVASDTRVVYVDNDPVVLTHARALLTSTQATTAYVDADLHDPGRILAAAAQTLDFTQPIGLMLLGILGHIDDDEARSILKATPGRRAVRQLPDDLRGDQRHQPGRRGGPAALQRERRGPLSTPQRSADYRLLRGLELVEPGVVSCPRWRPDTGDLSRGLPPEMDQFAGMGRKP